jgi:anti-sigma factor RsiW
MSLSCPEARACLVRYAADALGAEERRAVRKHLADCSSCFEEAAASDASLLFVRAGSEVPGEEIAQVLAAVRTGIALKMAEQRLDTQTSRRPAGAIVLATAAVVLMLALPGSPSGRQPPALGTARVELANAATAEDILLQDIVTEGPEDRKLEAGLPAEATVYDWNPGSGQPRVVWIINRSLDI